MFRESTDRRVRREAFETYFGEFRKFQNTLAAMYAGSVKFDCYYADVRNFDSALARALFVSNVPVTVYDALVEAIHGGLPVMRRYLDLRRRVLGLEELHLYDLYTPMVDNIDFTMPYEDAKVLVKKHWRRLVKYTPHCWIKLFTKSGLTSMKTTAKRPARSRAAFTACIPYVLLNYTDTLDDALYSGA